MIPMTYSSFFFMDSVTGHYTREDEYYYDFVLMLARGGPIALSNLRRDGGALFLQDASDAGTILNAASVASVRNAGRRDDKVG